MELSGKCYLCSDGDTFDSVALAVYGDEKYASELLCANPDLVRQHVLMGGDVLALPVVDTGETQDGLPSAAPWKVG